jgi:predicted nucleic acid-binding protein
LSSFVLDASIAGRWLTEPQLSPSLKSLRTRALQHGVVVPTLFRYEVTNLLVTYSRLVDDSALDRSIAAIQSWPVTIDLRTPQFEDHVNLALTTGLSAYDATYVELAQRLDLPLATADTKLGKAAKKLGIKVLGLPK